jgi:hypothetical protein
MYGREKAVKMIFKKARQKEEENKMKTKQELDIYNSGGLIGRECKVVGREVTARSGQTIRAGGQREGFA